MSEKNLVANRAAALRLVPVSRETIEKLDLFAELFLRWQKAVHLVAPSTLTTLWTRHIADSLQLVDLAPNAKTWADLGTGGGFPGLIVAIALRPRNDAMVHLIESDQRKAAFLREAVRVTKARAMIHTIRIESVAKQLEGLDIVTARALAPMPHLLTLAYPLLNRGAKGLFLKGQHVDKELTEATKSWNIQYRVLPSRTNVDGKIVLVDSASPLIENQA
jgi:16S rRNA (guanine527-N7)-methyltransferase